MSEGSNLQCSDLPCSRFGLPACLLIAAPGGATPISAALIGNRGPRDFWRSPLRALINQIGLVYHGERESHWHNRLSPIIILRLPILPPTPPSMSSLRFILCAAMLCATVIAQDDAQLPADHFTKQVRPFLQSHCVGCHSGESAEAGIQFEKFTDTASIQTKYELWEKTLRMIRDGQMPPADEEQPSATERVDMVTALQRELNSFDCASERHPGRVTIRRLNRAEYNNTIRDLLGLDIKPADDFPTDDVGEGFDNIGDVLTIPPVLMEKYLESAQKISAAAFADEQARKRVLVYETENNAEKIAVARRNINEFAERAWRRPLTAEEQNRLFRLMQFAFVQGAEVEEIFKTVIAGILAHPNFLFRVEQDPGEDAPDGIRKLSDYELASRLSYFLWSSMPDTELFELAGNQMLSDPDVLKQQVTRMLADEKSVALIENFGGQWLQLRDVDVLQPDPKLFADFDPALRAAMKQETEEFLLHIIKDNRSVMEFLTADYTFANERLARHYGMDGVKGDQFRQVALGPRRRGVLTHASILLLTSNPTRTSPVKRGKWILDNILAEPPPPPPPDVPELDEGAETLGSLREQMEQHRSNPTCAVCHTKMDALGFGLENFDAIGGWREKDGKYTINPAGELPGGAKFSGAADLMQILADSKKDEFLRCLSAKMLTYALGRGLDSWDRCAIREITDRLRQEDNRFHSLVTAIVLSEPFQYREQK